MARSWSELYDWGRLHGLENAVSECRRSAKAEAKKQKATFGSPFCRQDTALIPFAAERHQQAEQVDEQVVDVQIQRQRGHHIVGFAPVHDAADIEQDVGREDHHGNRGNRQRQCGQLEEQVGQRSDNQQDQPDEQKLAHEAEILLGHRGEGRQAAEDDAGAACGQSDQLCAVLQVQRDLQDGAEKHARQQGEAEQGNDTPHAVAQGGDGEHGAHHRAEHQQREYDRMLGHE